MEIFNSFFPKSRGESHTLNCTNSKTLQICLESVYPTVKLVLELRAAQHRDQDQDSVFFSIQTWGTIIHHASEIYAVLRAKNEKTIFINNELKVFTECMHDQCAVCFLDVRGKKVKIMLKTFSKMMQLGPEIIKEYKKEIETVNETAKSLRKFMDFILTQCAATRLCNDIKGYLEMLSNYSEPDLATSYNKFSYMSDTEFEDYYNENNDRCSYWNHHRHRNFSFED